MLACKSVAQQFTAPFCRAYSSPFDALSLKIRNPADGAKPISHGLRKACGFESIHADSPKMRRPTQVLTAESG
jgi:hypothetical protein